MYRTTWRSACNWRCRENAATGNRTPDGEKSRAEGAEKRYIWQLSGGQRQRVGLPARWRQIPSCYYSTNRLVPGRLHPRPDANPAAETLAGDGKQVLLITHDIEEAVFMATDWFCFHPAQAVCWSGCRSTLPPLCCGRVEPQHQVRSTIHRMREYVLSRVFEQREAFS